MDIIEEVVANIENRIRHRYRQPDEEWIQTRAREMVVDRLTALVEEEYF